MAHQTSQHHMTHKHTCVLCGATNPRGVICKRCSERQEPSLSLFTSMTTDYLTTRRRARSIRIHQRRIYGK